MTVTSDTGPFALVPRWVIRRLSGEPWALMLYSVLADHADYESGEWQAARKQLADEMGCGLTTFKTALAKLIQAGAVRVTAERTAHGDQGWNRYVVCRLDPTGVGREGEGGRSAERPGSVARRAASNTRLPHQDSSFDIMGFDDFWRTYPRKVGKPNAEAAYRRAVKRLWREDNAIEATIMAGLLRWCEHWRARNEPEFVPHPATWLNQHRWNDVPTEPTSNVRRIAPNRDAMDDGPLTPADFHAGATLADLTRNRYDG